jgi:hypothetical protein
MSFVPMPPNDCATIARDVGINGLKTAASGENRSWHAIRNRAEAIHTAANQSKRVAMIAIAPEMIDENAAVHGDRQLHAAAANALAGSNYGPLRKLQCHVRSGVIEITGSVSSFYLKQLAQAAVLQLYPAGEVRNLVEVVGEPSVFVALSCDRGAR